MKYRLYLKRALSIIMISVMLSVSAGSAFSRGYDAEAASGVEVLGGSSLFEFLLGLFGVSVPALGASHRPGSPEALYQEYLETLQAAGADDALTMQDYMDLINGDTVSITSGVIDSVQDFLEGKFGSLSSGSIQSAMGGYSYVSISASANSYASLFLDFASSQFDYYFAFANGSSFYLLDFSDYNFRSGSILAYLSGGWPGTSHFGNVSYFPAGDVEYCSYLSLNNGDFSAFRYAYNSSVSGFVCVSETLGTNYTMNPLAAGSSFCCNFPVPVYIYDQSSLSLYTCSYQGLKGISKVIIDDPYSVAVSFGGYSQSLINSVSGKVLSMDALSASNTAVRSAVEMNTLEDEETGVITYTDAIAGAVSDAIARALADAGVIEGDITKPGTGEGEGEEEEKPLPVVPDGLMDLLKKMGDAIVDGFSKVGEWIMDIPEAIGGFFVSLWEWLQKIWEAICALPGQTADAFKDFFSPGESDTPGEGGDPPDNAPFLADLSSLFPFCVPFDLIRLFKVLQSAPQAPCWEIPLNVPSIGLEYTFVIDMSQFDTLAQIFRACETIGFICGLILITRKLIRG